MNIFLNQGYYTCNDNSINKHRNNKQKSDCKEPCDIVLNIYSYWYTLPCRKAPPEDFLYLYRMCFKCRMAVWESPHG